MPKRHTLIQERLRQQKRRSEEHCVHATTRREADCKRTCQARSVEADEHATIRREADRKRTCQARSVEDANIVKKDFVIKLIGRHPSTQHKQMKCVSASATVTLLPVTRKGDS